jgi:hypothetical protein
MAKRGDRMKRRDADHYGSARPAPVTDLPLFGGAPKPDPVTHQVEVRAHLRAVPGERPATGAERRDAALAGHETRDASSRALAYVRDKLAELYRSRVRALPSFPERHFVTADDADRILREWPQFPKELLELPKQNWRGAIFTRGTWERTGRLVSSKREHLNATDLPCWRLRDAAQREQAS